MKAAQEFYDELLDAVHPPKGCKIVLRETEPNPNHDFNWLETAGGTPTNTIADVIAKLRRLAFRFALNFYRGIRIHRADPRSKACRSK